MRPFCVMLCAHLEKKEAEAMDTLESLGYQYMAQVLAGSSRKFFLRCGGGEGCSENASRPSRQEGVCHLNSLPIHLRAMIDLAQRAVRN